MYINNLNYPTTTCEECMKKDVCKYISEFKEVKEKVDNIETSPLSPIRITIGCTKGVKNSNSGNTRTYSLDNTETKSYTIDA